MTHDEALMLIISCAVVVEIVATYRHLRKIPHALLILGSFAGLVLGSLSTVVEGFLWAELFNWLEHLALMAGAILLTLWCALVFGPWNRRVPDAPDGIS